MVKAVARSGPPQGLGAKPLVVAETEHHVALASEEVGIQRMPRDPNLVTYEPYPLQVKTW